MNIKLKRIISLIIAFFAISFNIEAQTLISFNKVSISAGDYIDDPELGHRSASQEIIGVIDWNQNSLILPIVNSEEIVSYEILDENSCVFLTSNDEELILTLSRIGGTSYSIRVTTIKYQLIGVYTPQN